MRMTDMFHMWLTSAEIGESFVYNEGLTYEIPTGVQDAALSAYNKGLVELFQRKGSVAMARKKKDGSIDIIHNYEYIAVRVSSSTSRRLDFNTFGFCRAELARETWV